MRKNFSSTGSHCNVLMFINNVREAFETSVTCNFLSVKHFDVRQETPAVRRDDTHINDPRLDSTKQEVVLFVGFAYSVMMVD